jgi:tRNA-dihydrouridine synthase A
MLGREAYHNPYALAQVDSRWYGDARAAPTRAQVVDAMIEYASKQISRGVPLRAIARHMLGLYQGRPGARAWRRHLSDSRALQGADAGLLRQAMQHVESRGE